MEVDERVPWFLRVESIECGVGNVFRLVVWGGLVEGLECWNSLCIAVEKLPIG